jgi:hypothetical protein
MPRMSARFPSTAFDKTGIASFCGFAQMYFGSRIISLK